MPVQKNGFSPIITIGSGNIEKLLVHDGRINLGHKHLVEVYDQLGGSCINYTLRLINMGNTVFPIPFIGNDTDGSKIQEDIFKTSKIVGVNDLAIEFIESEDFFMPGIMTPNTTVVIHDGRRTIFSPKYSTSINIVEHIKKRLSQLSDMIEDNTASVMIGHISPDGQDNSPSKITREIVDFFRTKQFIFANFGNSQLKHGIDFWQNDLNRTDLVQLNLAEAEILFRNHNESVGLFDYVKWFQSNSITAVITLNKLGAIGTYKDGRYGIVLAWPLNIPRFIDPTGAGDAFAAGIVSTLCGNRDFSFEDFQAAIIEGRLWASYVCTKVGAAGDCPDREQLDAFRESIPVQNHDLSIINDYDFIYQLLQVVEKAY